MARKKSRTSYFLSLVIVLIIIACAIYFLQSSSEPKDAAAPSSSEVLHVLVIDVGQGDSILLKFDSGETMLIDAATQSASNEVLDALEASGTEKIDILIATHPHADHIGGMADVINRYNIGRIYMPDMTSDSKTYRNLKSLIEKKDIELIEAYAGFEFEFGPAVCTIVSPHKDANKDANNESIVLFLDYGETDFLFTGDMEEYAEHEVLKAGYDIDADVLKVAHHGSHSSTSEAFLREVTPEYAVISCGEDNKYGHPHKETLSILEYFGITTFRTDLSGDILFIADGQQLKYQLSR